MRLKIQVVHRDLGGERVSSRRRERAIQNAHVCHQRGIAGKRCAHAQNHLVRWHAGTEVVERIRRIQGDDRAARGIIRKGEFVIEVDLDAESARGGDFERQGRQAQIERQWGRNQGRALGLVHLDRRLRDQPVAVSLHVADMDVTGRTGGAVAERAIAGAQNIQTGCSKCLI